MCLWFIYLLYLLIYFHLRDGKLAREEVRPRAQGPGPGQAEGRVSGYLAQEGQGGGGQAHVMEARESLGGTEAGRGRERVRVCERKRDR